MPSQGDPTAYQEPSAPEPIKLPDFDKADEPGADEPSAEKTGAEQTGADEPSPAEAGADEPGPGEAPKRTGRISYQDENTAPREPTLAEQRARQQAERRALEEEEQRWDEEARKAKQRKRMLIGGAVGVGLVAIIAIGYAGSGDEKAVEARCTDDKGVVVDDSNCVQPAAAQGQQYHSGGFGFIPIFIGGGGRQYHYNYGGSGGVGQVATGGTTTPPKDSAVRTPSGKSVSAGSSSVKRGGFGVSGSSSGGSGKSGGS